MTDFNTACIVLAGICFLLFIIQLLYIFCVYNRVHRKARRSRDDGDETPLPPLSVIIVTKDSGEALTHNLPMVLEQDYPEFEVIVVNDRSAGEDEDILKRLSQQYTNLYHTFIPDSARYVSRKKLGIAMGIRASRYDWVVLTEPYCCPVGKNWLRSLAREMSSDTDIVLGYSNYEHQKGWFARRITVDTFFHALRFLGRALAGCPYMGVGRNMAYRKSLYMAHKGFSDHLQLRRGEDDLFINAVATQRNTRVAVSADSIVRMPVPPFRHIWYEDKMNAMATSRYYKGAGTYGNALETWTCVLFHLLTIATIVVCCQNSQWIIGGAVLLLWALRFACEMTVFQLTAKDLQEKIGWMFPLFDILRPFWSLSYRMGYLLRDKSDFFRK